MIPGQVIALLTFPGVIIHELAHQFFCRVSRVAVFDVCYFRFGNPAGYVIHEPPTQFSQQIWIAVAPFIVNSVLGALVAFPASIAVLQFDSGSLLDYVLIWLGVSIGMHAFPSRGDAKTIWTSVQKGPAALWKRALAAPIVGLIYIGSFGSMVWLDLAYGVAVAGFLSKLVIWMFA